MRITKDNIRSSAELGNCSSQVIRLYALLIRSEPDMNKIITFGGYCANALVLL